MGGKRDRGGRALKSGLSGGKRVNAKKKSNVGGWVGWGGMKMMGVEKEEKSEKETTQRRKKTLLYAHRTTTGSGVCSVCIKKSLFLYACEARGPR